jgi:agmatinase
MPGSRFGPDTIRKATDSEKSHSYPLSIGRKTAEEVPLSKRLTLEDIGDLEVMMRLPEAAAIDISEAAAKLAQKESKLLFLGGDHFITYPILKGLTRGRKGRYGLVYFDAHADLYSDLGGYQLSHATTVRRIVDDRLVKIEDIAAFDLRSALPEQRNELTGSAVPKLSLDGFTTSIKTIGKNVDYLYVSIDLDVLSPEVAPGVSHPESGGLSVLDLVTALRAAFSTGKVIYVDLVEFNPLADKSDLTSTAARDLVKEILTGFAP